MEVKLKDLLASKKRVNKEKLYGLLEENPNISDEALGKKMTELFGVSLSRRSINQYRNELKK